MNRWFATAVLALAVFASACGGGDGGGGSADASNAAPDRPTFAPPTLTSAEVCERIGKNDIVAIYGGVDAAVQPNDATTGCWFSINPGGEATSPAGETTVTLLNNGGRESYEYEVERWTANASKTVTPVEDFTGVNFDGDAILVEQANRVPFIIMFLGGGSVWQVAADAEHIDQVARTVAGQVV